MWQADAARDFGVSGLPGFIRSSLHSPKMMAVLTAYLAGFVLHAVSVVLLPLYLAQACVAFSMPVTAVWSAHVFHERLSRQQVVAVSGVCLGIVLLAIGAGSPGSQVESWGLPLGLSGLLVFCGVGGVAALCRRRPILTGAIAGCGYAGSAIAMRGISVSQTPTAAVLISALMLPAFGLLAFWLYSMAMARTEVTPATGALIVTQTFVPAVVGLVFLGDDVSEGGAWFVSVGLVLGTVAAIRLAPRSHARPSGAAHL